MSTEERLDMAQETKVDTEALLARLRRIEGQIRGIHRMVSEDRMCEDVLTQLMAALRRPGNATGLEAAALQVYPPESAASALQLRIATDSEFTLTPVHTYGKILTGRYVYSRGDDRWGRRWSSP